MIKQTLIEPRFSSKNLEPGHSEIVGAWLFSEERAVTISVNWVTNHFRKGSLAHQCEAVKRPHNLTVYYKEVKSRGRAVPRVYARYDNKKFTTLVDRRAAVPFEGLGELFPVQTFEETWRQELCRVLGLDYESLVQNSYDPSGVVLRIADELNTRRYPFTKEPVHDVKAITSDDIRHFTQSNLGKRYTNKPIMKVIVEALDDRVSVNIMRSLRSYFSPDELPRALRQYLDTQAQEADMMSTPAIAFMDMMNAVWGRDASFARKVRILCEAKETPRMAYETSRMLFTLSNYGGGINVPALARSQSLQDLHDAVLPEFVRYQEEQEAEMQARWAERDASYARALKKMDNPTDLTLFRGLEEAVINGLTIRAPRTPNELTQWGSEMAHCIGSYKRDLVNGEAVFLGIYNEEGRLICNVHAEDGRMIQVLGKYNQQPGEEIVQAAFIALYTHNIVGIDAYDEYVNSWIYRRD